MSRMAGASTLLRPQSNLPSIQDRHACLAVNGILLMAVATLLPSAVLCFWEVRPSGPPSPFLQDLSGYLAIPTPDSLMYASVQDSRP